MTQLTRKLKMILDSVAAESVVTNVLLHAYLGKLRELLTEAEVGNGEFTRFVDAVFDAFAGMDLLSGKSVAEVLEEKMESETSIGYYMPFGAQPKDASRWSESLPAAQRRGYDVRVERRPGCLKSASFRTFGIQNAVDDRHERGLTADQVKSALRSIRGDMEDYYGPEPPTGGRPALV